MTNTNSKKEELFQLNRGSNTSDHTAEALRIATESTRHQQFLDQNNGEREGSSATGMEDEDTSLSEYDLKSRDSKYRRWTPRMDQFLIKLLSDVVHSFPKGVEAEMNKKAWAYVTGQLRATNPETVYSTYTKYSCQQHLLNVNHHRYKVWYSLMLHQRNNPMAMGYSYRWNPDMGRFQIVDNTSGSVILDERQVKSLLYSDALSLPLLNSMNKANLIVNDFFLSDNLSYMSRYHNEVLPMLIKLDPKFLEGFGDIYGEIPRFEFRESREGYFKPLVTPKHSKVHPNGGSEDGQKKRIRANSSRRENSLPFTNGISSISSDEVVGPSNTVQVDDSVDPELKRSRNNISESAEFENVLASAAIAAINSPSVTNGRDSTPFYIKDRKWFNKLVSLNESGLIDANEVLTVCEGVRDGKIPLFMLNILDQTYYPNRNGEDVEAEDLSNEETVKRIREFMIPMTFNS